MIAVLLATSSVASALSLPLGRLLCRRGVGWLLALVPAALFLGFLSVHGTIEAGQTVTERLAWAPSLSVEFTLRLDGFAFLFCLLVTGVGALVVIYADAYLVERAPSDRARFLALILFFMTAMLGTVLADNLVVLFLFWEATSLFSFLLIGFDVDSPSARRSALMALHVTAGGGLALLAAILLIGVTLGSYSLSGAVARAPELARSPWIVPILAGIFTGSFTKSA
jgi:multicomponent Na+:H+ antiporter subunit A